MQNITQSTNNILQSFSCFYPEIVLAIGFLLVILFDLFGKRTKQIVFPLAICTLFISGFFLFNQFNNIGESQILFNGMFSFSKAGNQFKLLVLVASILSLLFFNQDERLKNHPKGINDFYSIFLGGVLGMFLLVSAANLLMVFLSIEMISLASYLMVNYSAYQNKQAEAGMKYVLFGAVASAIMLYGISLIYGFTGTINLYGNEMVTGLNQIGSAGTTLAIVLFMVGIGFKLSFVPFHFWTPDAYQEAPTSVTAFLTTAPKIAVFGLLFFIMPIFQGLNNQVFHQLILIVAAASMIIGNTIAIFQDNPKRMMAYSSIGHTGFILMMFLLPQTMILNALLFYLFIYLLMNIGSFLAFADLEYKLGATLISDYKGIGKFATLISIALVILMVSLIGLPPTAGFMAKFLVFSSLINLAFADIWIAVLLITAAITTVISLFYYLKIPLYLFLKKSEIEIHPKSTSIFLMVLTGIIALVIIVLGIFPSLISF
jgi:NADH-quinone oxidoreductase subunit N